MQTYMSGRDLFRCQFQDSEPEAFTVQTREGLMTRSVSVQMKKQTAKENSREPIPPNLKPLLLPAKLAYWRSPNPPCGSS